MVTHVLFQASNLLFSAEDEAATKSTTVDCDRGTPSVSSLLARVGDLGNHASAAQITAQHEQTGLEDANEGNALAVPQQSERNGLVRTNVIRIDLKTS